ncbi:MAG: DUF3368 domain-containing protein [Leptolyngbya sp. SIO4C5]|nr:DUF3368 domain-containing protein [Leptolyngbya sp. SIO4C5]
MTIVLDTSPLIFLNRLELLDKFLVRTSCYIPQAVYEEITIKEDETSQFLSKSLIEQKIVVQPIQLLTLADRLKKRLGKGEAEALTLALELQASYVILDDFAGRQEALRLRLKPKGTLAIAKKLQQEGEIVIDDLDLFYERLISIGFRVKRSLFDKIFHE